MGTGAAGFCWEGGPGLSVHGRDDEPAPASLTRGLGGDPVAPPVQVYLGDWNPVFIFVENGGMAGSLGVRVPQDGGRRGGESAQVLAWPCLRGMLTLSS